MPLEQIVVRHELRRRELRVLRAYEPVRGIRRVTFGGPDLADFDAAGPADHVKLFLPARAGFDAATRDFTPYAQRDGEVDIDFVLHGDEGPASAWAASADIGDAVAIGGPRGSRLVPHGLGRLLLVVDETAYPAAARWIAATPDGVPIEVVATSAIPFADYADPMAGWAELSQLGPDDDPLPVVAALAPFDESTLCFLAGEAGRLVPLRRHLRRELGLPKEQVQASGYWRRGTAGLDHHAALDPDDPD